VAGALAACTLLYVWYKRFRVRPSRVRDSLVARPQRCRPADVPGAATSTPFVTRVSLGPCSKKWTTEYLEEHIGDMKVSVHVSSTPDLNFVTKNFAYEVMSFSDFAKRALSSEAKVAKQYYYYRATHHKRNKPASLEVIGTLQQDFQLPVELSGDCAVHSTVLRVASPGMRMWLHYDICCNFLCCIRGRKRVVLIPPSEVRNLYISGSSSMIGSGLLGDAEHLARVWREYPLARKAWEAREEVILDEGDVLFIPALWFHCVEALPTAGKPRELCISVNTFLIHPEVSSYHDPKDVWANRELLPAQDALRALEERVLPNLRALPLEYRSFYCQKAAAALSTLEEHPEVLTISGG